MKYSVEKAVTDYEGKPLKDGDREITYRQLIGSLLQNVEQGDTGEVKGKLFDISTKLYGQKEPEFTAEQIVLINERVGKFGTPLAIGRVKEFLEPKADKTASESG